MPPALAVAPARVAVSTVDPPAVMDAGDSCVEMAAEASTASSSLLSAVQGLMAAALSLSPE